MDHISAKFTSLARKDLPHLEYAVEFSRQLAVLTVFNYAALNSLFWIWANYHRPELLQAQSPAHHHPAAQSLSPSPPQTESICPPRPMTISSRSNRTEDRPRARVSLRLTRYESRQLSLRQWTMQGNVRAWRKAHPLHHCWGWASSGIWGPNGPFSLDYDDAFNGHQHCKSLIVFHICI